MPQATAQRQYVEASSYDKLKVRPQHVCTRYKDLFCLNQKAAQSSAYFLACAAVPTPLI
jgi:hypothetical protein